MPVIDTCVHHHWRTQGEIMQYMSRGWREYLGQPAGAPGGLDAIPILQLFPYLRADGDKLDGTCTDGGPSGSSYEVVKEQLLDRFGIDRAVLTHDRAMFTPLTPNPHLAEEIARAVNDWTVDHWLSEDDRLYALLLVPNQTPDASVAEIERMGATERMVGVLMAANGLSKPFGHPIYHPIYRAAADRDLPIVIHAGGDALSESLSHATAGGLPATYAEYAVLRAQPLMHHLVSLIAQGVFIRFPTLRVQLVGAGISWLPSLIWRFDSQYITYRREMPWLKRPPSEYLREHVRFATYPLDVTPRPEQLLRLLEAFGGFEDMLMYGSGFPNWDTDEPTVVESRLPPAWRAKVFSDNALEFFRWSARDDRKEQPISNVGATQ
jgi:predicted TIM-barrel fold metal-dependent hydrolase